MIIGKKEYGKKEQEKTNTEKKNNRKKNNLQLFGENYILKPRIIILVIFL